MLEVVHIPLLWTVCFTMLPGLEIHVKEETYKKIIRDIGLAINSESWGIDRVKGFGSGIFPKVEASRDLKWPYIDFVPSGKCVQPNCWFLFPFAQRLRFFLTVIRLLSPSWHKWQPSWDLQQWLKYLGASGTTEEELLGNVIENTGVKALTQLSHLYCCLRLWVLCVHVLLCVCAWMCMSGCLYLSS